MGREHQRRLIDAPRSQRSDLDAPAIEAAAAANSPAPSPAFFAPSCEGQQGVPAVAAAVQSLGTGSQDVADRRETPPPTLSQRRRSHCGHRASVVVLVVILVGLAVTAWTTWMALSKAREAERLRDEAAMPCGRSPSGLDSVQSHLAPDDRRNLTIVRRAGHGGGAFCTIDAAQLLSRASQISVAYLKLGLTSALSSMPTYGAGKGAAQFRPSVHLELPASVGEQSRVNEVDRLCNVATEITSWTADSSDHVRGDLSVKAGRVSIKNAGYYHVYSQISIEDRSCRSATGRTLRRLRHSILRYNPVLNVVAGELIAVETWRCSGDSRGQQSGNGGSSFRKPSYLGATFLLLRDDEVYVMVSCIVDLTINAAETYFGMHMV